MTHRRPSSPTAVLPGRPDGMPWSEPTPCHRYPSYQASPSPVTAQGVPSGLSRTSRIFGEGRPWSWSNRAQRHSSPNGRVWLWRGDGVRRREPAIAAPASLRAALWMEERQGKKGKKGKKDRRPRRGALRGSEWGGVSAVTTKRNHLFPEKGIISSLRGGGGAAETGKIMDPSSILRTNLYKLKLEREERNLEERNLAELFSH